MTYGGVSFVMPFVRENWTCLKSEKDQSGKVMQYTPVDVTRSEGDIQQNVTWNIKEVISHREYGVHQITLPNRRNELKNRYGGICCYP
jgi:hypothetical protein